MVSQAEYKKYLKRYQCPRGTKKVTLKRKSKAPRGSHKVYCDGKYIGIFYTGWESPRQVATGVFQPKKGFRGRGLFSR